MTGAAWALLAGVGFGTFQALNRRALRGLDVYVSTFLQLLVSTVILAGIAAGTEDVGLLRTAPPAAIAYFSLASFFHFFSGWTLLNATQKRIGAARTSTLVSVTPLFGTVIAALTLREVPGLTAMLGIVLMVIGVALVSQPPAPDARSLGAAAVRTRDEGPMGMRAAPAADWMGIGLGLSTALCWAISPIFIRRGLVGLPSPLLGVTVGMAAAVVTYGIALAIRPGPTLRGAGREAVGFKLAAAALVGLSTWARWVALDLAPVAIVLALTSVSVPTVIILAPLVAGRHVERVTAWVWLGGGLVVGGSLLLLFYR